MWAPLPFPIRAHARATVHATLLAHTRALACLRSCSQTMMKCVLLALLTTHASALLVISGRTPFATRTSHVSMESYGAQQPYRV